MAMKWTSASGVLAVSLIRRSTTTSINNKKTEGALQLWGLVVRRRGFATSTAVQGGGNAGDRIVVLGGNGYVGSAICELGVQRGLSVVSINRSGKPVNRSNEPWVDRVQWVRGDMLNTSSDATSALKNELVKSSGSGGSPIKAFISCLGAFGNDEFMFKINGEANAFAARMAKSLGIPRFVYISAHGYGEEGSLPQLDAGTQGGWGYFRGKRYAEQQIRETYSGDSVGSSGSSGDSGSPYYLIRPSFIYGSRKVGNVSLPLWLVGKPLSMFTAVIPPSMRKFPLLGAAAVPPVAVEQVANAAIVLATKPPSEYANKPIITVDDIIRLSRHH